MMLRKENRSQDREAHFARACAIEMHIDMSQEPFCMELFRKSAVRQSGDTRFAQACAIETNMDISQEPFCIEICRKSAGWR